MLGGKFRDRVRMYCDTEGIDLLYDIHGAICAPLGTVEELSAAARKYNAVSRNLDSEQRISRNRYFDNQNIAHPFTGIQVTECGYDILEQYVREVSLLLNSILRTSLGGPIWLQDFRNQSFRRDLSAFRMHLAWELRIWRTR